jgi:hypothetical protein
MHAELAVKAFWMTLILSMAVPGVALFIRYREATVIRIRGFWSVMLQICSLVIWAAIALLAPFAEYEYANVAILEFFLLFLNSFAIIERCVMLFISFRITTQSMQRAQDKFFFTSDEVLLEKPSHLEGRLYEWLLEHRRYFHQGLFSYSKLACYVMVLIWEIPIIFVFLTLPVDDALLNWKHGSQQFLRFVLNSHWLLRFLSEASS